MSARAVPSGTVEELGALRERSTHQPRVDELRVARADGLGLEFTRVDFRALFHLVSVSGANLLQD